MRVQHAEVSPEEIQRCLFLDASLVLEGSGSSGTSHSPRQDEFWQYESSDKEET
jgi:hypothetical protein